MSDRESSERPTPTSPTGSRGAAPAGANPATCHPDVICPVCTARGKLVEMVPVKAHYQCPECRYFDSCCM
jgi:hypothetical protein